VEFLKPVKGETYRVRLEKHVTETVQGERNNNKNPGKIEFVNIDQLSSSFFQEASSVILNSKALTAECVGYYLAKAFETKSSLLVICKSQAEFHESIESIQTLCDKEDEEFHLFSLVCKDTTNKSNDGLVFVVLTGYFVLKNSPIKIFFENLSSCLRETVKKVVPKVYFILTWFIYLILFFKGWKSFLNQLPRLFHVCH
jgi:hypothetical protein